MDEKRPRKRTTRFGREARTQRILERLRGGSAYGEVAREEGLSERRVHQIVAEHLKGREAPLSNRAARIEARFTPEALRILKRAAEIEGRTLSDFVATAAQEAARRTVSALTLTDRTIER